MVNHVESLIYTFESIYNQTLGSHNDGKGFVDIEVTLNLVRDNGLKKFMEYCDERSINYSIEYIGDNGANLRVIR